MRRIFGILVAVLMSASPAMAQETVEAVSAVGNGVRVSGKHE